MWSLYVVKEENFLSGHHSHCSVEHASFWKRNQPQSSAMIHHTYPNRIGYIISWPEASLALSSWFYLSTTSLARPPFWSDEVGSRPTARARRRRGTRYEDLWPQGSTMPFLFSSHFLQCLLLPFFFPFFLRCNLFGRSLFFSHLVPSPFSSSSVTWRTARDPIRHYSWRKIHQTLRTVLGMIT